MTWLLLFGLSLVFGLFLTRAARNHAARFGLVDAPDGHRKVQARPVPVVGGPAVLAAALLALAAAAALDPAAARVLEDNPRQSLALLAAAVLIAAVGLVDDAVALRARTKLLGQFAAVAVLTFGGGFVIESVSLLDVRIPLGVLAVPFTAFWLLACVNALNLIDGMDGLLGTVGLIALLTLGVIALLSGNEFTAVVALALAGAVLGFLYFNLPPASVYMGDSGSMLIGLVVGAVSIPASLKGPATVALLTPVGLLVLPMLDTTAAILRRKLVGRGMATADRGHLHHVLQRNGLTTRRALGLVAALALIAAAGALVSTAEQNDLYAVVAAGGVVLTLVLSRLFGRAEFELVKVRVSAAVRAVLAPTPAGGVREFAVRLQGKADWGAVWGDLTGAAGRLGLHTLRLDVAIPAAHEDYHARWDRVGAGPAVWRLELPLVGDGRAVGRLEVAGGLAGGPIGDQIAALTKIVESAEVRASAVAAALPAPRPAPKPAPSSGEFVLAPT